MKKLLGIMALSLLLISSLAACAAPPAEQQDPAPVKMGRVEFAAHGTKSFTVTVVAMQGDKIAGASIDEYQFLSASNSEGVPNSDADFGGNYPEGMVLGSKLTNNESYSANMAKAGSTVQIADNFAAIEEFAIGKTIAELEQTVSGSSAEELIDAVTGATLADTKGYLESIIAAAKAAE